MESFNRSPRKYAMRASCHDLFGAAFRKHTKRRHHGASCENFIIEKQCIAVLEVTDHVGDVRSLVISMAPLVHDHQRQLKTSRVVPCLCSRTYIGRHDGGPIEILGSSFLSDRTYGS